MANNRYFFDKRDWKKRILKYIICAIVSFIPIVLFNVYVGNKLGSSWLVILIDCAFLLLVFAVGNLILDRVFDRKEAKIARLRKEREELEARKKKILEDSYKQKRIEKERAKKEKVQVAESSEEKKVSNQKTKVEIIEPKTKKSRKK